jgi:hypothetical protein
MLTLEQKEKILYESSRECNLDAHITQCEKKSDLATIAQRIMGWTGFIKNNPHKQSYLYFDSVDSCFYIDNHDNACVTFGARWIVGSKDLTISKFERALMIINKMLETMQDKINQVLREGARENESKRD